MAFGGGDGALAVVAGEVVVKAHASPDASTRRCGRGSAANKRHACICARDPSPPFPPPLPRARECSRSIFCPGAAPSQVAAERQSACLHFQVRTHTHTHAHSHYKCKQAYAHKNIRTTHAHTQMHTRAHTHTCRRTYMRIHSPAHAPSPQKIHPNTHAHTRT